MKLSLSLILIVGFFLCKAQPPAGYYDLANGLTGEPLQNALHSIIDNHFAQSYSSLHTHFELTDSKQNGTVWDMYSDNPGGNPPYVYYFTSGDQCGNYSGEGDCYNREHSWPKSWFDDKPPMYTDLYHIYPTDGYVNGRRSNYPFGEVGNATWSSQNGSKVGNSIYPGYSGVVFEPIDEYKGDFARTYFYMSTRYLGEDNGWPGSDQTNGSQLKPWALAMMKEWHLMDTVSIKEVERNNAIFSIQNNRNPFIDHPEYVAYIWGGPTRVNETEINKNINVYPVPADDNCVVDHKGYYSSPDLTISLFDLMGRKYHVNYSTSGNLINIDSSNLSSGLYFIILSQDNRNSAFARIVIYNR